MQEMEYPHTFVLILPVNMFEIMENVLGTSLLALKPLNQVKEVEVQVGEEEAGVLGEALVEGLEDHHKEQDPMAGGMEPLEEVMIAMVLLCPQCMMTMDLPLLYMNLTMIMDLKWIMDFPEAAAVEEEMVHLFSVLTQIANMFNNLVNV